ncbi:hypothetical protein [Gordonia insulae]|uniref:Uncharacterized protein n=1 Tax=Gordonia insulae TaxID=2420509 RepID=A0A3G8JSE4_9ACTN|nr:hypothetical protein [Gordonia insulae]AZG48031.1 hypothetical protein D7316_04644 [Gordonia insulae]
MPPDPRLPASGIFSISPSEITSTARIWRYRARLIAEIDFGRLGRVTGPSSRVVAALRAAAAPVRTATTAIGSRLSTMSVDLELFRGVVEDEDTSSARTLSRPKP